MSGSTDRRWFLRQAAVGAGSLAWLACGGSNGSGDPDASIEDDLDAQAFDASTDSCTATTSDVLGPFFEQGAPMRADIAGPDEPGQRLVISGRIVDLRCTPIAGVLLEVWQADRDGAYHEPGADYRLRGQLLSDEDGRFELHTIRPGNYEIAPDAMRPAHIHVTASRDGYQPVTTQLYFAGDPFLPPNDACSTCGSDDPARHIELAPSGDLQLGTIELVLAAV